MQDTLPHCRWKGDQITDDPLDSSRSEFLPGQYFDIRLEVHSPVNGSEARKGEPDGNFTFSIKHKNGEHKEQKATDFFKVKEPELEHWNFTWYEGKTSIPLATSNIPTFSDRR